MKKLHALLFTLLFLSANATAQTRIPYLKNGKYGLSDPAGHIILPCEYEETYFSNEFGYGMARKGGLWAIIDSLGRFITGFELKYPTFNRIRGNNSELEYIPKNLIVVKAEQECKFGILNLNDGYYSGLIYYPFNYFSLAHPNYTISCYGMREFNNWHGILTVEKGMYQMNALNKEGREIFEQDYKNVQALSNVYLEVINDSHLAALYSIDGKMKIPFFYKRFQLINDTIFIVSKYNQFNKTPFYEKYNKFQHEGIINASGELVVDTIYDGITSLDSNYFIVRKQYKTAIIKLGEGFMFPFQYQNIWNGAKNQLSARNENSKCGLIDKKGNIIVPFIYDYLNYNTRDSLYQFRIGKKAGLLTLDWQVIFEQKVDRAYRSGHDDSLFIVEKKGKFGVMKKNGSIVVPIVYDQIYNPFKSDFYTVKIENRDGPFNNDSNGAFNKDGKEIIPVKYKSISSGKNVSGKVVLIAEDFRGENFIYREEN